MHILEGGLGKGQVTVAVTVPDNTDIDTEISVFGEIVSFINRWLGVKSALTILNNLFEGKEATGWSFRTS